MRYIKNYSLFESLESELKLVSKKSYELREDLITINIEGSDVGYDFIIKKSDEIEVIYDYEPDEFINKMGINDDGSLKESELKKWLIKLNEDSIGNIESINGVRLIVDKFENVELIKKGILKISYNNKVITFLVEEGDLEKDDIISFYKNEDKLTASKLGLELNQNIKDKLLYLYY